MKRIKNNLIYDIKKEASNIKLFPEGISKKLEEKMNLFNLKGPGLFMFCAIIKMYVDSEGRSYNVEKIKEFYKINDRAWVNLFFNKKDKMGILKHITKLFNYIVEKNISTFTFNQEIEKIDSMLDKEHFIKKITANIDKDEVKFFYFILFKQFNNFESFDFQSLKKYFDDKEFVYNILIKIKNNSLLLQKNQLIEVEYEKNYKYPVIKLNIIKIDRACSYKIKNLEQLGNTGVLNLRKPDKNKHKMIFPKVIEEDINRIKNALSPEKYKKIIKKMKNDGLNEAMTFLFYGESGTGKSMSVYEIAAYTGRDIYEVDMGTINGGGLVGDMERETKKIFTEYKNIYNKSSLAPILLINEADSIFTKRVNTKGFSYSGKNIQINIILDELDKFKGILFATTNLEQNFDKAMDRRFMQKIKIAIPDESIRTMIWKQKLPSLDINECKSLSKYGISGGVIENIARKCIIISNLELKTPKISEVIEMTRKEVGFRGGDNRNVGFIGKVRDN